MTDSKTEINGFFEVVNLTDESTMLFANNVSREMALAYANAETSNRLSEFFACEGDLASIAEKFPFIYGSLTLACGDWCAFQEGVSASKEVS